MGVSCIICYLSSLYFYYFFKNIKKTFKALTVYINVLDCIVSYIELHLFLEYLLITDLIFSDVFEESDCALYCFLFTFLCAKPWFHDSFLHKCVDLDSHTLK